MKPLLTILTIALILGGIVGSTMVKDPGYVLLAYHDWSVETSLWLFLILLLVAYLLVRITSFLLGKVTRGHFQLSEWNRLRHSGLARKQMVRGLLLMSEGQWQEAQNQLLKNVDYSDIPLINYLAAARAADELNRLDERDELLHKAHETTAGSRFAVGLTRAELQLHREQWEQALATLLSLLAEVPDHPQGLDYLQRCYVALRDWAALSDLIPRLRKNKVLTESQLQALTQQIFLNTLEHPETLERKGELRKKWREMPKGVRRDEDFIERVAQALLCEKSPEFVESILKNQLNRQWSDRLVTLYGQLTAADSERQLIVAENWLKERPNNAALLLTLGRLCMRNRSWAQAREYFEASLRSARGAPVYAELGRLCLALGDRERGAEYLSKAFEAGDILPRVPLPNR